MARGGLLEVGKGPFVTWVMGTRDWPKNDFTKPFFSYVVSWTWVLFYVKKKKNLKTFKIIRKAQVAAPRAQQPLQFSWGLYRQASLVTQTVKNPPAMQEVICV